jgi:Skp family chaperone for outer membrane proteins
MLGPIGIALIGLSVGALQADHARREFAKITKRELVKYLPQFAQEQWQPVYNAVQDSFDRYDQEVNRRIDEDIDSRKAELDNLLKQKESREVDRDAEFKRLRDLQKRLQEIYQSVETSYQSLLVEE